jgi:DNA mismatch repair ATPase MutS
VLISAELGKGNKGTNYVLRISQEKEQGLRNRILAQKPGVYTFHIHPRDESGARALSEVSDRGIHLVANALAQSTDHILSFFSMLRTELAFYIGCLRLHGQLAQKAKATCFPVCVASSERRLSFHGLYDLGLTFGLEQGIVANDVNADNKDLVIITGANQGGKSTLLRSIGVSQVMMQCGMFAPAESFSSNVCDGVFTHYKREEDATLKSGKLDEELSRMSDIVDNMTSRSIVLFNESFSATNEREGAEIARQIVFALCEKRVKMIFVTHLYEFARVLCDKRMEDVIFLRAEREADGRRTFKLVDGEPLQTSYGEDLYKSIFGVGTNNPKQRAKMGSRNGTVPASVP